MAKQYIPGVSGLLTEPNPADSPSNTLTDAENVIIDQNGKVQARHGLNVTQSDDSSTFASNSNAIWTGGAELITGVASSQNGDTFSKYVHYSSFFIPDQYNTGTQLFKLLEYKNSSQEVMSVLFVKQRKLNYITNQSSPTNANNFDPNYPNSYSYLLPNFSSTDKVVRCYQISADSGQLVYLHDLPYTDVSEVFNTESSIYLQTEDGIAESNVDDLFPKPQDMERTKPSTAFFTITWPSFPKITHKFIRSTLYDNWLGSNEKVGIRITYFREMGYDDKIGEIYESQPSTIYTISNTGKKSIPVIDIDFLGSGVETSLTRFLKWNNFVPRNGGRKFGIKIYRTRSVPIQENLPEEYFECYDPIYFTGLISGQLSPNATDSTLNQITDYTFVSNNQFRPGNPILNVGDIYNYIPAYEYGTPIEAVKSKNEVKYYSGSNSVTEYDATNDFIPTKIKITKRVLDNLDSENNYYQFTALNTTVTPSINLIEGDVLSKISKIKLVTTSGSPVLKCIDVYSSALAGYTVYHRFTSGPAQLKFLNTAPAGFAMNTFYYIQNANINGNFELTATSGGTSINAGATITDLVTREIELSESPFSYQPPLTPSGARVIRSYRLELNINDEFLFDIGSQLYTNPNLDGEFYTNTIAPKSQFIAPYKDFYVHAGVQKPLQATLSVIKQPEIEQHSCIPAFGNADFYKSVSLTMTSGTATFTSGSIGLSNGNVVYFSTTPPTPFVINTNYYVVNAQTYPGSTFQLSSTLGGTAITPTQSGTPTMIYQRWTSANANLFNLSSTYFFDKSSTVLKTGVNVSDQLENGELFIESAITGKRRYQIQRYPTVTSSTYTILNYNTIETVGVEYSKTISNLASSTINIDQNYLSQNLTFDATIFERPYLTLKLTSLLNEVTNVRIQTEPIYNRNGYYSLTSDNGELDDNYLTYDRSFNEMNAFKNSSNTTVFRRGLDNIYHVVGENEGQVSADGTYIATTTKWINDSTGDIYFNKDANTLLIKNAGNIDIKKFTAPGIIMIQSNNTDFILFTYSSIDTSTATANSYTFKSVALQYVHRNRYPSTIIINTITYNDYFLYDTTKLNAEIVANPNYFLIKGNTYFFFLEGTTIDGLVLYPYAKDITLSQSASTSDIPTGLDIRLNAVSGVAKTTVIEYYTPTDLTAISPTYTLLPHRKMSKVPVGFFQKSKNHSFIGLSRNDAGGYLDLYAWQIINKFNVELQKTGINAYLSKGSGIGEILITYPDGQKIEIMNGDNTTSKRYPGKHIFAPDIGKSEFITIASRLSTDYLYENNQAAVSRRKIPELTPLGSTITIGKPEKKFIGYATNSDDLFVFKEDGIFRVIDSGNVSSNIPLLQVFQLSTNLICQAAGSIKEINDEIIFLSQYGFISISGGNVSNISGNIQKDILTLLQISPKDRIKAFVNESKQLYYCTLINEVDPSLDVKSGTYIFNIKTRQWSFMDHEILDGLEDSNKRNLVAYRQKTIVGTYNNTSIFNRSASYHSTVSCDLTYPFQTSNLVNNFYFISRERHTNNIMTNAKDQYDYISENLLTSGTFSAITNGFTVTLPFSLDALIYHYAQKLFKFFTPPTTIQSTTIDPYADSSNYLIVDSPIQMFVNRQIYAQVLRNGNTNYEYYEVKLVKFEYITSPYQIKYTFEYLSSNTIPAGTLTSLKLVAGIPVKLTFNPESGQQPDTNKLFQEYSIHTETVNKGMLFTFKTDSVSGLTTDRRFAYDPAATNRNIFRTYIPVQASRGRYLIRQVKHDVPLENLIITGQTIVMRDSGSTRVQKDKDVV